MDEDWVGDCYDYVGCLYLDVVILILSDLYFVGRTLAYTCTRQNRPPRLNLLRIKIVFVNCVADIFKYGGFLGFVWEYLDLGKGRRCIILDA
jgi:hypothetical protein